MLDDLHVVMQDTEAEQIKEVFARMGTVHRLPQVIAVNRTAMPALAIVRTLRAEKPVAMLGDRVAGGPYAECDFLGRRACFPTGIFAIAAAAGAPIVLTFAFNVGSRAYEVVAEPPHSVTLPRHGRREALAAHAQWFADRLAHYARLYPYNWFNYYDFWEHQPDAQEARPFDSTRKWT